MKKLFTFQLIAAVIAATLLSQPSEAASLYSAIISNLSVTSSEISVTYQLPVGCPLGDEKLLVLNSKSTVISNDNYPNPNEVLTASVVVEIDLNCAKPPTSMPKTRVFPNTYRTLNIVAFKPGEAPQSSAQPAPATQTQRSIRFVAMVQGEGMNSPFTLEEISFEANKPVVRTVLGTKGINAILGQTPEGIIVKTIASDTIQTWLVTTKKWTLLSKKIIYIEPGVLTPDNKYLIGRKVADVPSTKIVMENLSTGSLSTLFDTSKSGKGFVCGAYSDPSGKYAYFSHISPSKTNVYRIDLATKKLKLLGHALQGFCISSVTPNGHLAGIIRDSKYNVTGVLHASEKNPDTAAFIGLGLPAQGINLRIGSDAGPYTLVTDDLFVLLSEGMSDLYLMSINPGIGGKPPQHEWEGPVSSPALLQFMRLLPPTWQMSAERPKQP